MMSSKLSNILLDQEILLESGTNEVEFLVFRVGQYRLGINVAKVREIISDQEVTRLPDSHPSILGCFRLREVVVPCISLHSHLKEPLDSRISRKIILTEFNRVQTAFLVDSVERIHRISWEAVQPMPTFGDNSLVTSVINLEGSLVLALDFETIVSEITRPTQEKPSFTRTDNGERDRAKLVIVDDSRTVRAALQDSLEESGFKNVRAFANGKEAWDWLRGLEPDVPLSDFVDIVVSDVEMPAMDGLHLTKNIKQSPRLGSLPVVLYSSIATPDNLKKGKAVGADAQITKPELSKVVETIDSLLAQHGIA